MSETQIDTTQARPREAAATQADAAVQGRHRGQQATSEEAQAPVHGRHRRPDENAS
ncbi:hypothetical protein [Streptomyces coffeae]|uniref:DUF5302 domain-containing protein n=1 Tax=Streptomyces coffeae TaxID=621382 RepID=A0ABS1NNA1_9ACTN|nr:hypothetical protein [Streptomyces coffeae]MBL1101573.1 hypothetical protein [Streptomyces coffeae]